MRLEILNETNKDLFTAMVPSGYLEGQLIGIGCVEGDVIQGVAIASAQHAVYEIKYIYTEPSERRKGVANFLLEGLLAIHDQKYKRLPIAGMYREDHEQRDILSHMLSTQGFSLEVVDSPVYTISRGALFESKLVQGYAEHEILNTAVPLSGILPIQRENLVNRAAGWNRAVPLDEEDIKEANPQLSMCLVEDGEVRGLLLVEDVEEGIYNISYLFLHPDYAAKGISFFKSALRTLAMHGKEIQAIMLTSMDERIEKALVTIFGDQLENHSYQTVQAIKTV